MNQLAGDIELMRSRIITQRAVANLNLDISYYAKGTILDFELYRGSPFEVAINIKDSTILDRPFFVEFNSIDSYTLRYTDNGIRKEEPNVKVNQWLKLPFADLKISIKNFENISNQQLEFSQNAYYFVINNKESVVNKIIKDLMVVPYNPEAKSIAVQIKEKNSAKAVDIVNSIIEEYNKYDVEKSGEAANSILKFIDGTLEQVNESLAESEQALEDFKRKNKIIDPNNAALSTYGKMSNLEDKRAEILFQYTFLDKLKTEVQKNNDVSNYLVILAGLNQSMSLTNELNNLQRLVNEREELLFQSTNQTEIYKAYEQNIANQKDIVNNILINESSTLKQRMDDLDQQLNTAVNKLGLLPQQQVEFGRLTRMYSINEKFYSMLLERKAEFSITLAGFVPKT